MLLANNLEMVNYLWKYLWEKQQQHRESIFAAIEGTSPELFRKRSSEQGWCIEEIIRHIIFTQEFWIRRVVQGNQSTEFHSIGVENNTQAETWYNLKEILYNWKEIDQIVFDLIKETEDFETVHTRVEFNNLEFSIRGVIYHLLQHELEHWGMIAERLRTLNQPYWEF